MKTSTNIKAKNVKLTPQNKIKVISGILLRKTRRGRILYFFYGF